MPIISFYNYFMNRTLDYHVTTEEDGLSVERFLKIKGFSAQNLIDLKKMPSNVLVNQNWVHFTHILRSSDHITVNISETASSENIVPTKMDLNIVYEDEDIIVVNKPAGLSIHPSKNDPLYSLANGLAYYYQAQNKPFIFRCSNRLDKNTTGLTVIAKHMLAASNLSNQVSNRSFSRTYLAIVKGHFPVEEMVIEAPIGRVPGKGILRQIDFTNGEFAKTHASLVEEKNGHSLISLKLETGRTHQIRIHMKYIGFPLIGDDLYNPDMALINRHALHSSEITFLHPITGEQLTFSAPLPDDMKAVLI